jgi:glycosyltransferase involved in cell wall biosynthesis
MKSFSLVIPAYNEAKNLPLLLQKTLRAAKDFGFSENDFSLILIENGSRDNSLQVIEQETVKNQWTKQVRVVRIENNQGYGHGLYAGLQQAHGEVVGWTHADLQCDPKNAFIAYKLYCEQKNERTLIKGTRSGRLLRDRMVSFVFETLARLILGLKVSEINAQPKVFPKSLLAHIEEPPSGFAFDLYVLYCAQKQGYGFVSIPVLFPPRIYGVSHWAAHFTGRYKTIWGMILYMVNLKRSKGRL